MLILIQLDDKRQGSLHIVSTCTDTVWLQSDLGEAHRMHSPVKKNSTCNMHSKTAYFIIFIFFIPALQKLSIGIAALVVFFCVG